MFNSPVVDNATQLRVAQKLSHYRFSSVYQPILSLSHSQIVGFEALLRTQDQHNQLHPLHVIESLLDGQHELASFDYAARSLHLRGFTCSADPARWLFLNVIPEVAVLSIEQVECFAQLLKSLNIPPNHIVIEILESGIDDLGLLQAIIDAYKTIGCLVALDDFGAGASNFDRIWKLSPDIIKVDRSMLIAEQHHNRQLLSPLVALLQQTQVLVLLEGIENQQQASIAVDSGADLAQGFYFAKPTAQICDDIVIEAPLVPSDAINILASKTQALIDFESYLKTAASLIAGGYSLERASASRFNHACCIRTFLLNETGNMLASWQHNLIEKPLPVPRFLPLENLMHSNWRRRDYFRQALRVPGHIFISHPYMSVPDGQLCLTFSIAFIINQQVQVLCADFDYHRISKHGD